MYICILFSCVVLELYLTSQLCNPNRVNYFWMFFFISSYSECPGQHYGLLAVPFTFSVLESNPFADQRSLLDDDRWNDSFICSLRVKPWSYLAPPWSRSYVGALYVCFCCLFGYIDPASAQRFLYHLSVVPVCTAGHCLCVVVVDSGAHTFVSRWPCDALRSRRGCSVCESWWVARCQLEDVRDGAQRQSWRRACMCASGAMHACLVRTCRMAHVRCANLGSRLFSLYICWLNKGENIALLCDTITLINKFCFWCSCLTNIHIALTPEFWYVRITFKAGFLFLMNEHSEIICSLPHSSYRILFNWCVLSLHMLKLSWRLHTCVVSVLFQTDSTTEHLKMFPDQSVSSQQLSTLARATYL
jgi:hypothetical protein